MKTARFILAACACLCFAVAMAQEGEAQVPNSLADAKVGEWASYRLPNDYIQKLTVIKRVGTGPEALVTIKIENIYEGEVVNVHEYTHEAGESPTPPRIPADEGVTIAVRQENADIRDKQYPVTVIEITRTHDDEDSDVTEWWTTAEIPVFGIVKRVEDGEVQWEIDDWGDA